MQKLEYQRDEDGLFRITKGKAEFIADRMVLIDFAADLAAGLPDDWPHEVLIAVGSAKLARPQGGSRPVIGIQTEHLFDASGARMWGAITRRDIRIMIQNYDYVLDLSVHNNSFYQHVEEKHLKKLTCGPYVFPGQPSSFQPGDGAPLFFGWYKERRQKIVDQVREKYPVEVLENAAWGNELRRKIAKAKAILNIHFRPGAYAEAPRLLKAYLAGKPVLSEQLGYPFVMERHALSLHANHPEEKFRLSFDRFSEEITMRYVLSDYLKHVLVGIES